MRVDPALVCLGFAGGPSMQESASVVALPCGLGLAGGRRRKLSDGEMTSLVMDEVGRMLAAKRDFAERPRKESVW